MTPDPASGIGASSIGVRLAELEQELSEAESRYEYFQLCHDIVKTMTDAGINDLRNELISCAESAWDTWDHTARCYAVEEFRRIGAIQSGRKKQADIDAGIDPYGEQIEPRPGRSYPDLPEYEASNVGILERAAWGHKNFKFRHPCSISGDLLDVRSELASTQPG